MKIQCIRVAACEISGEKMDCSIICCNSYKYFEEDKIRIILYFILYYKPQMYQSVMNLNIGSVTIEVLKLNLGDVLDNMTM